MNPKRVPLIAGNWKLNHGGASARVLAQTVARLVADIGGVEVIVAPPFTALSAVHAALEGTAVALAAQDLFHEDEGAFTGEVSAPMLIESGCSSVIVGHSERRKHFGETDASVARKVAAALRHGLMPIVCVGETLAERQAGTTFDVIRRELSAFTSEIAPRPGKAVIAYEPVWAIGTGEVASPAQAEEVHALIRAELRTLGSELAERTRILYGGSVDAKNARGLLECADIDGALVGGSSLKPEVFCDIVRAASSG